MVQVSYPGVYVQEAPSGSHTITGVATSIAAFVGMSKDGIVNEPSLVLGFTDYTRRFSADISQGEMTDQVRQFFLNGGQQAYIVRVGQGILNASVLLQAGNGTTLKLTALSGGENGNNIRAIVDYDTADPERTFNLTVFRELTDPSGNTTTANQEIHQNLSMDPNSPQFVETVVDQNSALIGAEIITHGTPGTHAITASGTMAPDIIAAIDTFIPTGGQGKFKISAGGDPFKTITIAKGALTDADSLTNLINQQLGLTNPLDPNRILAEALSAGAAPLSPPVTMEYLQLSANRDLVLAPASDNDIAVQFGLGVAHGGVEIGLFSNDRPLPSGLVSKLGANPSQAATDLTFLHQFGASLKAGWTHDTTLALTGGDVPFASFPGDAVSFPELTAPSMRDISPPGPFASLVNVRDCMFAIATAISGNSLGWKATASKFGYRLTLRPGSGPSTAGEHAEFDATDAPAGFVSGSIFDAVEAKPGAAALEGGDDGSKPSAGDYQNAYLELDKVDIFNLLILPRSAKDANDRKALWGPASVFAVSRRAFLIMDLDTTAKQVTNSSNSAAAQVVALRNGLTKDHAATYWPRVQVNPDGDARFIDANGTIAGIMARIDGSRGVWKAPAGLEADLRGVLAVEVPMSDQENGIINPLALNAIRSFTNGIVSWGARTMDGFDGSGDDDFKYVPVRRVELFIEESLLRGLKFAVFEPNDEPLWSQIRLSAGAFMNNLFRQGAFKGSTQRDAFFVKCDSETTTQDDINQGIVNVVVGFAPLKPAEFVVITIQQLAGQVQV